MEYQEILNAEYFGNSIQNYLIGLCSLILGFILASSISSILIKLISRIFQRSAFNLTYAEYKDHLRKPLNTLVFLVFLYFAVSHLEFPQDWNLEPVENFGLKRIIRRLYLLFWGITLTRVALKIVAIGGQIFMKRADSTDTKMDDQLIPFAVDTIKILVIVLAVLIVASSIFELNIGSLVAGLGIGGLALALAAKESLENLFGSFTIFMDKPFLVGDLVTIGSVTGTVEKVGFRSTRVRTLEKSYVTIPNKMMVNAELDNWTLRTFRRVKFNVGLTYGTKMSVMKSVVEKIQKYIDEHEHTNQDGQVKFMDFGSYSLDIMVMYYIDSMDWSVFLNIKEEINYKIMEIIESENSDFAFPTQTLHLNKENN